jgi:hypothetical protein
MQRLSAALHGTLGSYLHDALQEGSADAVACLLVPRAQVFSSFLLFAWWPPLLFLVRRLFNTASWYEVWCRLLWTSVTLLCAPTCSELVDCADG